MPTTEIEVPKRVKNKHPKTPGQVVRIQIKTLRIQTKMYRAVGRIKLSLIARDAVSTDTTSSIVKTTRKDTNIATDAKVIHIKP